MKYSPNCRHFRGDIPCKPHKQHGVVCEDCSYFLPRSGRILVIKLGATGDVIRTSVILEPLKAKYPDHEIWWLSYTPEVIPSSVDKRMAYTLQNVMLIQSTEFDVVYNLDKDAHACALMASIQANERYGFTLDNGLPAPVNELARHKFITGIFDSENKKNVLSYPQEIIELCGFTYTGQEYQIDPPSISPLNLSGSGPVVGLNTGCGERWMSREWPLKYWIELAAILHSHGCRVVLLGGPAEHERNLHIQEQSKAVYTGLHSLPDFVAVVNQCDIVVTTVTMAMHVAIALKKRLVLMNNVFNRYEFELYGRGVIIEPPVACKCFFAQTCTNEEYCCMEHLAPDTVANAVLAQR